MTIIFSWVVMDHHLPSASLLTGRHLKGITIQLKITGYRRNIGCSKPYVWLTTFKVFYRIFHCVACTRPWLAVDVIFCCWGDFYEWICTECNVSSISSTISWDAQRFTVNDYKCQLSLLYITSDQKDNTCCKNFHLKWFILWITKSYNDSVWYDAW